MGLGFNIFSYNIMRNLPRTAHWSSFLMNTKVQLHWSSRWFENRA